MLGMRIAALRKTAGWNQAELARRLQISPSAVGRYEQGRREPSAQMLVDIARVFDVSLDYLMTGTPQPGERDRLEEMVPRRIDEAQTLLARRKDQPFSRQELTLLFAAMLLE